MQQYVGYRTKQRRKKQRKKRKVIRLLAGFLLTVILLVLLGGAFKIYPFDRAMKGVSSGFKNVGKSISRLFTSGKRNKPFEFIPEGKKTVNYLIAVTKFINGKRILPDLVLVSYDSRDKSSSLIYFPSDLRLDVPGAGTEFVSNLIETDGGRMGMSIASVSNLLGVDIDRFLLMSDFDLRRVLKRVNNEYEIEVKKRTPINDSSLKVKTVLSPGVQKIGVNELVAYLTHYDEGEERSLISRQMTFVPIFLSISRKPGVFNNAMGIVKTVKERIETDATAKEIAGFWQNLSLVKNEKITQVVVPEKRVTIEDKAIYILDRNKLEEFRKKYVKSDYLIGKRFNIEILNGCREVGIGLDVISRLDTEKFSVMNSGNADNFSYSETIIRVYSQNKEVVEAAKAIRKAISVGKIEFTPGAQDLIDITVVVGNDYLEKHKRFLK